MKAYTQQNVLNTITTNTFSVIEDLSLNGRILVSGDASLNGRLFVGGNGITSTGNIYFQNGASIISGDYSTSTIDTVSIPNYGLSWQQNTSFTGSSNSGATGFISAWGGIRFQTQGVNRMNIIPGGNVGIGTTNPSYSLDVSGAVRAADTTRDVMGLFSPNYGNYLHIGAWNAAGSTSKNIVLNALGGNVGIGITNPAYMLHVNGSARFGTYQSSGGGAILDVIGNYTGSFMNPVTITTNGIITLQNTGDYSRYHQIYYNNVDICVFNQAGSGVALANVGGTSWRGTSDARLKKDIVNIENALDKILQLRPVWYKWIASTEDKKYSGFIAQEVEGVIPEVVGETRNDKYDFMVKGITTTEIIPFLVKGIQEQQSKIQDLQTENTWLKSKNNELEVRITSLEARLTAGGF